MLSIKEELRIDLYGQNLISIEDMLNFFSLFEIEEKREYLEEIISLINQSKPFDEDIAVAIKESGLKSTYTPCVMLKKGVATHNLILISKLPENELDKVLTLFLSLFRIAYLRRYSQEKGNPEKWWYWDLSDEDTVQKILNGSFYDR